MADNTLGLLGLALRGGNLAVGEEPVAEACRTGRARLVLLAADAGGATARRGEKLAQAAQIPLVRLPCPKAELGWSLGRASCALAAPTDGGLAAALVKGLARQDESLLELAGALEARAGGRREKKTARAGKRPADMEA